MIYLVSNQVSLDNSHINIASIEDCVRYIKDKKVIGLDIETTRKYNKYEMEGLDPYTSSIVMLQIGDIDNQYVIDTRNVDISSLFPYLESPDIIKVGHNIKFEYKHILVSYGIRLANMYDTMLTEQILFNGFQLSNSLEELNKRYLNITVDKSTRLGFLTIGSRPFTTKEIEYGAEDIVNPLRIRDFQMLDADQKDLNQAMRLEFRFLAALGEMECNGIGFNKSKWLNTYNKNLNQYTLLLDKLNNFIVTYYSDTKFIKAQLDLFNSDLQCGIKWSSSKQVIEFFRYLDICPQAVSKTTKKLGYTVEAKEVKMLLLREDLGDRTKEFIKLYLQTKECEQAVTTFGKDFLKHVNPITGRIHSNYKQMVNTGRMSSTSPNNQNIPSKKDFRDAFEAPIGTKMINADYSGQENIILANKAMDKDILEFYDKGLGDMHSFIAAKLFPDKLTFEELKATVTKKDNKGTLGSRDYELLNYRQIAKSAGFALAYGGTGFTIASNLGISEKRGNEVYEAYFSAFPGLKNFFESEKKKSLKSGYILIDKLTRRKFYFYYWKKWKASEYKGDYKEANYLRGKMERASQNYTIQGEAGSITKYAAVLIYEHLKAKKLLKEIKLVLMVHDEILLESIDSMQKYAANLLQSKMEEAGSLWCKRVPLKAQAVISQVWEH